MDYTMLLSFFSLISKLYVNLVVAGSLHNHRLSACSFAFPIVSAALLKVLVLHLAAR
jgi:hypothetical protein